MTQQLINIGVAANDRSGDPIRTAFNKVNQNFTDIYSQLNSLELQAVIPSQTNNNNKFLTTDGTSLSWGNILPSQTNNNNKFLTTDGTSLSWGNIPSIGSFNFQTNKIYNTNGINIQNDLTTPNSIISFPSFQNNNAALSITNTGALTINVGSPTIKSWNFSTTGELSIPTATSGISKITYPSGNDFLIGYNSHYWNFSNDGSIHFPDASIQTTAWTGYPSNSVGVLYNNGSGNITWKNEIVTDFKFSSILYSNIINTFNTPTVGYLLTATEPSNGYNGQYASFNINDFSNGIYPQIQVGWNVTDNQEFTSTIISLNQPVFGTIQLSNNWPTGGNRTYTFRSPDYTPSIDNYFQISVNNNKNWIFEIDGGIIFPNGLIKIDNKEIISTNNSTYASGGSTHTVWTATSVDVIAAKVTIRVQSDMNARTEIFTVNIVKDSTNINFTITDQVTSNSGYGTSVITANKNSNNILQVQHQDPNGWGNAYTIDVVEFMKSY